MIVGRVPRGRFGYLEKRFAPAPLLRDALRPVHYLNSSDQGSILGFIRQPVYTILIDLAQPEPGLTGAFRNNTRNEIARAVREGTSYRIANDYRTFLDLYGVLSRHRPVPSTSAAYFDSLGEHLRITEAIFEGHVVATHAYVADRSVNRVRLIRSASSFHELNKNSQQSIGRANRFLHYQDMLLFRAEGIQWYDLGGYDPEDREVSQQARQVSKFKESFGGRIVQEANYLSLLLYVYRNRRLLLPRQLVSMSPAS